MLIHDGRGSGRAASVSKAQRLNVSSKSNPRIFYISRDDSLAFNAVMPGYSATAGDYVFYLKNTSSTRDIFIKQVHVHGANAALWKLFKATGTAAAGTAIEPTNLNLKSGGIDAEATCMGGGATITGLTIGDQLGTRRNPAGESAEMCFEDTLLLGPGDAIVLEYDTGTTGQIEVDCMFHFEEIGWY